MIQPMPQLTKRNSPKLNGPKPLDWRQPPSKRSARERAKKVEYIKRRDAGEAAGERIETLRLELPAIEEENRRAREDALKAVLKAKQQP